MHIRKYIYACAYIYIYIYIYIYTYTFKPSYTHTHTHTLTNVCTQMTGQFQQPLIFEAEVFAAPPKSNEPPTEHADLSLDTTMQDQAQRRADVHTPNGPASGGSKGGKTVSVGLPGGTAVKTLPGLTGLKPGAPGLTGLKPGAPGLTGLKPGAPGLTAVKPGAPGLTVLKPGATDGGSKKVKTDGVGSNPLMAGGVEVYLYPTGWSAF
jgi:hypothetical protein